jgi:hypothetical protein
MRSTITQKVAEKIPKTDIENIDVGLDLTGLDYKFFFKVNIPKEKVEEMIGV